MKKTVSICMLFLALTGCTAQSWKYSSEPKVYQKPISNLTVGVNPLRDIRKNENGVSSTFLLVFVPFVPYTKMQEFNVPDAAIMKAPEDFSKAMAEEINNASIFKDTYYTNKTSETDLILTGTLKESKITRYGTLYGLSFPGELLWFIGFPAGKNHNDIVIEYKLMDKNYNVYFEKEYVSNVNWLSGFYYGTDIFRFEETLKPIAKELLEDLNKNAPNIKLRK